MERGAGELNRDGGLIKFSETQRKRKNHYNTGVLVLINSCFG